MSFCSKKLEATNVVVVPGVSLTITVPNQTFVNQAVYTLGLCNALPTMMGTELVSIVSGAVTYPLLDCSGNSLRAGRLRGKRRYRMIFGSDPSHFLVLEGLCPMRFSATPTLMKITAAPLVEETGLLKEKK